MEDVPERIDFEEDTPRGPQVDDDENDDPGPNEDEEVIITTKKIEPEDKLVSFTTEIPKSWRKQLVKIAANTGQTTDQLNRAALKMMFGFKG